MLRNDLQISLMTCSSSVPVLTHLLLILCEINMASNLKNPPKFEEGTSYETWKKDVCLWTKLTDLDKKKQGIAIDRSS